MFEGNLSTPTGRSRAWIDSLFVDHAILRQTWTNFRTVIPGRSIAATTRHHGGYGWPRGATG